MSEPAERSARICLLNVRSERLGRLVAHTGGAVFWRGLCLCLQQNHNTGARRRTRRASFQLDEQDEYELSQVVTLGKHVVLLAADDEPWPQVMS